MSTYTKFAVYTLKTPGGRHFGRSKRNKSKVIAEYRTWVIARRFDAGRSVGTMGSDVKATTVPTTAGTSADSANQERAEAGIRTKTTSEQNSEAGRRSQSQEDAADEREVEKMLLCIEDESEDGIEDEDGDQKMLERKDEDRAEDTTSGRSGNGTQAHQTRTLSPRMATTADRELLLSSLRAMQLDMHRLNAKAAQRWPQAQVVPEISV